MGKSRTAQNRWDKAGIRTIGQIKGTDMHPANRRSRTPFSHLFTAKAAAPATPPRVFRRGPPSAAAPVASRQPAPQRFGHLVAAVQDATQQRAQAAEDAMSAREAERDAMILDMVAISYAGTGEAPPERLVRAPSQARPTATADDILTAARRAGVIS